MNAETQEVLTSMYSYIRNYALKEPSSFLRNIRTMKSNIDLEWFNCALIAQQQRPGAQEAVIVNTIAGWESVLEIEELKLIDDTIKPIPLLSPVYFEEENYLTFDRLDVYYLSDFEPISNRSYTRTSAIGKVLKKYEENEYLNLLSRLKKGWQDTFLHQYLDLFAFYKQSDDTMKKFYTQTLRIVFGKELHIEGDKTILAPDLKKNKPLQIYKNLYEIIVSFHIAYASYLKALSRIDRNLLIEPMTQDKKSIGYQKILAMSGTIEKEEREASL